MFYEMTGVQVDYSVLRGEFAAIKLLAYDATVFDVVEKQVQLSNNYVWEDIVDLYNALVHANNFLQSTRTTNGRLFVETASAMYDVSAFRLYHLLSGRVTDHLDTLPHVLVKDCGFETLNLQRYNMVHGTDICSSIPK